MRRIKSRAFTRLDMVAVLSAVAIIAVVLAPAFGAGQQDSARAVCFNNLRLIGRAVHLWAADHQQQFAWRTSQERDGGTYPPQVKPGAAWYEYFWHSNELVTPKILACPSDTGVRQAGSFDSSPNGFTMPAFRNNAVSYPLHLDGSFDAPKSWLSADRNFRSDFQNSGCSTRVSSANALDVPWVSGESQARWTNAVHGPFGHVLLTEGSVEFTATPRLKELLFSTAISDNGQLHFLRAR